MRGRGRGAGPALVLGQPPGSCCSCPCCARKRPEASEESRLLRPSCPMAEPPPGPGVAPGDDLTPAPACPRPPWQVLLLPAMPPELRRCTAGLAGSGEAAGASPGPACCGRDPPRSSHSHFPHGQDSLLPRELRVPCPHRPSGQMRQRCPSVPWRVPQQPPGPHRPLHPPLTPFTGSESGRPQASGSGIPRRDFEVPLPGSEVSPATGSLRHV